MIGSYAARNTALPHAAALSTASLLRTKCYGLDPNSIGHQNSDRELSQATSILPLVSPTTETYATPHFSPLPIRPNLLQHVLAALLCQLDETFYKMAVSEN